MITGTHIVFFSENPEADRALFRDVFALHTVDAGHGWLIFALPPAEAAFHPIEGGAKGAEESGEQKSGEEKSHTGLFGAEVYLMCDDLAAEIKRLSAKQIECAPVDIARWGSKTSIRLPSGARLGLYEPRHPMAITPLRNRVKSAKPAPKKKQTKKKSRKAKK